MIKTKSGARKIEGTDNWREIFDDHNYTVDALDQLAEDMAIIVNGNKTAYASGAAVGQYVLLRNSTITDRADGMYKAAKAIPYNTTIDKTYLTAVSGGAINSLSDQIANKITYGNFNLSITTTAVGSIYQDGNDRDISISPPVAGKTLQKIIVIPTTYNRFVWVGRIGVDQNKITRMFVFTPTQETNTTISFDYIAFWN